MEIDLECRLLICRIPLSFTLLPTEVELFEGLDKDLVMARTNHLIKEYLAVPSKEIPREMYQLNIDFIFRDPISHTIFGRTYIFIQDFPLRIINRKVAMRKINLIELIYFILLKHYYIIIISNK